MEQRRWIRCLRKGQRAWHGRAGTPRCVCLGGCMSLSDYSSSKRELAQCPRRMRSRQSFGVLLVSLWLQSWPV